VGWEQSCPLLKLSAQTITNILAPAERYFPDTHPLIISGLQYSVGYYNAVFSPTVRVDQGKSKIQE
jgi:hypothetical protein